MELNKANQRIKELEAKMLQQAKEHTAVLDACKKERDNTVKRLDDAVGELSA